MHKDCIVLAGGFGTRLRSLVNDVPKCLADINGKPFLYYICKQLSKYHFCKVVFSVGYKKEMVKEWVLENRKEFGFAVDFAEEETPLGTGGAVKNALRYCDTDDVIIINGDTYLDVNFDELIGYQQEKQADITIALKPMQNFYRYGVVQINEQGQITKFEEKKFQEKGSINAGVYALYRKSFLNIDFPEVFSFEKNYLEKYISTRFMFGMPVENYFIDIGIPEDYERAQTELQQFL